MAEPIFHCLFCDDIRHEIGGKVSYMGVYNGSLTLNELPHVLPLFHISIKALIPLDHLDLEGEIVVDMLGNEQRFHIKPFEAVNVPPPSDATNLQMIIQVSCVAQRITKAGVINVYFEQGDNKTLLDKLNVVVREHED